MAMSNRQRQYELTLRLAAVMSQDYTATFDQAQNIVRDLRTELEQAGQTNAFQMAAASLAQSGLSEIVGTLRDAFMECVDASMEYEYQMSAVEAISQASGSALVSLNDKALELGKTTVFTATESAEAMTFMAQAGWDAKEILTGMTDVVNLAAASGTDLSDVTSIAADTLAGFGMKASDAGRLADVLAQRSAKTNRNVSLLGDTLQNAAAVAGALGFSIEDVSVGLGLMADAGVKGSRAGTTMRNILNGLAKGVTLTGEAIGDVEMSMFNDDGSAKGFLAVIRELRGYFTDMTVEERYKAASEIGGIRGYNGLLAILNATDDEFEKLYADINDCTGAAERMAEVRLDNLKGDVTLMKSALEGLEITVGGQLTPGLRGLAEWGTSILNGINEFLEAHPEVTKALAAITAGFTAMLVVLTVTAGVMALVNALKAFGAVLSGPVGWIALITAAFVGLGTYAVMASTATDETGKLIDETEKMIEAHEKMRDEYEQTVNAIDKEYGNIDYLISMYDTLSSKENRSASEKEQLVGVVEKLNKLMPELRLEYDKYADSVNMSADAVRNLAKQQYLQKVQEKRLDEIVAAQEMGREYAEQAEKLEAQIREETEKEKPLEKAYYAAQSNVDLTGRPTLSEAQMLNNARTAWERQKQKRESLENELRDVRIRQGQNSWEYKQLINEYAADSERLWNEFSSALGDEESASAVTVETEGYVYQGDPFYALLRNEPEAAETMNTGAAVINIEVNVEGDASEGTVSAIREGMEEAADEFETRMNAYQRAAERVALN